MQPIKYLSSTQCPTDARRWRQPRQIARRAREAQATKLPDRRAGSNAGSAPINVSRSTDTDIPRRTGSSVNSSMRASTTGRSRSTTIAAGSPKTPVSPTATRYHNHRPNAQRPSALRPMDIRRSDRCRRAEAGPAPAFATCASSKLIAFDTEGEPHTERRNHSGRSMPWRWSASEWTKSLPPLTMR